MRSFTLAVFTTSILALSACGTSGEDSTVSTGTTGGSTGAADTTASSSPTSVSATGPNDTTSGGTSNSMTGPTTGESGTTTESGATVEPGTTGDTTTEGSSMTDSTSGSTTDGGTTTEGTTGTVHCAAFGPMECMAQDACQTIMGSKLNLQKMCVGKSTFFECSELAVCNAVETYGCEVMVKPPEPFLFGSSCLPMGWEPCDAPPVMMPCK